MKAREIAHNRRASSGFWRPAAIPGARDRFGIIGTLQKQAGVELHVTAGLS